MTTLALGWSAGAASAITLSYETSVETGGSTYSGIVSFDLEEDLTPSLTDDGGFGWYIEDYGTTDILVSFNGTSFLMRDFGVSVYSLMSDMKLTGVHNGDTVDVRISDYFMTGWNGNPFNSDVVIADLTSGAEGSGWATVNGFSLPSAGLEIGTYRGNLTTEALTATPVPLPATFPMLFVPLAAATLYARRKRLQK